MSKHQLIYTSCKKGMYAAYDGQNVFSHDKGIASEKEYEHMKKYFGYREPTLYSDTVKVMVPEYGDSFVERLYPEDETDATGRKINSLLWDRWRQAPSETMFPMHEEIIPRMPHAFVYEKFENGQHAFVRLSYLGHDYMGAHGRLGNFLSHIVWLDGEQTEHYPCEYYKSSSLMETIDNDLVSRPERPDYLPEPQLVVGNVINFERVSEFLRNSARMEIFKNLLHAFILSQKDNKKIIICDSEENIMLWTAAVEYAFPLEYVKDVNINSYVFDPSSEKNTAKICGVFPCGTDYKYEKFAENSYVFDFFQNKYPSFDNSDKFYDFMKICFTRPQQSLMAFHDFLKNGYTLDKVSESIYDAYCLYNFFAAGIKYTDVAQMTRALDFSDHYALPQEKTRMINFILSYNELAECDKNLFVLLLRYVCNSDVIIDEKYGNVLCQNIIGRFLADIQNNNVSFAELDNFYNDTVGVSKNIRIDVYSQIFNDTYLPYLRNVIFECRNYDKLEKLCDMTEKALKKDNVSLAEEFIQTRYGQAYYAIVSAAFNISLENGQELIKYILKSYSDDIEDLLNMLLNLEGMANDFTDSAELISSIWNYVFQIISDKHIESLKEVNKFLVYNGRINEIFELYKFLINKSNSAKESYNVYIRNFNDAICKNGDYANNYTENVFRIYYEKLCSIHNDESFVYLKKFFETILKYNLKMDFNNDLVSNLLNYIPYSASDNRGLTEKIYEYQMKYNSGDVDGKVYLLLVAYDMEFKDGENAKDFTERMNTLLSGNKAPLNRCNNEEEEDYLSWIKPKVYALCRKKCSIERIFSLYDMRNYQKNVLLEYCYDLFIQDAKKDDNKIPYLANFMFPVLSRYLNDESEKFICDGLCELSKSKLEILDSAINQSYEDSKAKNRNAEIKENWEKIKEEVGRRNPVLNFVQNIFKKFKKK